MQSRGPQRLNSRISPAPQSQQRLQELILASYTQAVSGQPNTQPNTLIPRNARLEQAPQPTHPQLMAKSPQSPTNMPLVGAAFDQVSYMNQMVQNAIQMMHQPFQNQPALPSTVKTKDPGRIQCAKCGVEGLTKTEAEMGSGSWALVTLFVCCGCWACCCCPCCIEECQDTNHQCSNCGAPAGRQHFLCGGDS